MPKYIITICAFTDNKPNSVAYQKFKGIIGPKGYAYGSDSLIKQAADFYAKMLAKEEVNVISTRKIQYEEKTYRR